MTVSLGVSCQCPSCGAVVNARWTRCPACSALLERQITREQSSPPPPQERPATSIVLPVPAGGGPAEWQAGVAKLHPDLPPEGALPAHWRAFVNASHDFHARWADRAYALGWDALSLFGADRAKPTARYDRMGAVWQLACHDGARIVAMTSESITMRTRTGNTLTFHRKYTSTNPVPAWKL